MAFALRITENKPYSTEKVAHCKSYGHKSYAKRKLVSEKLCSDPENNGDKYKSYDIAACWTCKNSYTALEARNIRESVFAFLPGSRRT